MLCGFSYQTFIIDIILQTAVFSTTVQECPLATMNSRPRKFWDQVRDAIRLKHAIARDQSFKFALGLMVR